MDDPRTYVPVDGAPWRLSMGLRRLEADQWLEVDANRGAELRQKRELLEAARGTVLAVLPRGLDASTELYEHVLSYLLAHHPDLVEVRDHAVVEQSTSARIATERLHPIAAASLLTQEDLCVLEQVEGEWRLTAACVCFPSRWSLVEKLGCTLDEIHGPVPGFHDALTAPATRFFDRLSVDRPAWRLNWTLLDTPALSLPTPTGRPEPWTVDRLLEDLWFRVERQTLRKLGRTGAVVFTIRTYVTALADLLDAHGELAPALSSTLRTVPSVVAAYKGWTGLLGPLCDVLDAHDHEPTPRDDEATRR